MGKGCVESILGIFGRRPKKHSEMLEPLPGSIDDQGKIQVPGKGRMTREELDRDIVEIQKRGKRPKNKVTRKGSIFRDE